jgi:hypothetical protein
LPNNNSSNIVIVRQFCCCRKEDRCECQGEGIIYEEKIPHVSLQLWVSHPRKGASRGILIENIEENEVGGVISFLKEADKRNKDRFSKIYGA